METTMIGPGTIVGEVSLVTAVSIATVLVADYRRWRKAQQAARDRDVTRYRQQAAIERGRNMMAAQEKVAQTYGAKAGHLTQVGGSWVDIANLDVVEFDPPDGCGAEVMFKGNTKTIWHLSEADAQALRSYLEGMAKSGASVDEATQEKVSA
jgi:hypothetical protein